MAPREGGRPMVPEESPSPPDGRAGGRAPGEDGGGRPVPGGQGREGGGHVPADAAEEPEPRAGGAGPVPFGTAGGQGPLRAGQATEATKAGKGHEGQATRSGHEGQSPNPLSRQTYTRVAPPEGHPLLVYGTVSSRAGTWAWAFRYMAVGARTPPIPLEVCFAVLGRGILRGWDVLEGCAARGSTAGRALRGTPPWPAWPDGGLSAGTPPPGSRSWCARTTFRSCSTRTSGPC